ncbi:leucine-rich repeat domain-containing protein [Aureispira anguillae]|uniref:Leucine-rich repeat domain-containing protein n=1 Tax=Aureispira anguillae TaxID=2864201 RepID=A0A916DWP4_9BACT|nr:leucine-rich repeat domain-containing protein [Aureispira anguillae]BDS14231.1 leucine-rich repeat domain-containing protein [Aureispira anguillae]
MKQEYENICQLLTMDKENAKLGLEMLKGQSKELKAAILERFKPLLDAFGKSTIRSIPTILEKVAKDKLSLKERAGVWGFSPLCEKIDKIDIYGTKWKTLPATIGKLKNLESLELVDNELETLPETIKDLAALEKLNISFGPLKKIPNVLDGLTNLKVCRLAGTGNNLKNVPDSIGKLKQLEKLLLFQNSLEELPATIGDLDQLKELSVWSNKIKKLPSSIGQLKQLKSLDISANKLTELPETIANLSELEYLTIINNPLPKTPEFIGELSNLRQLKISLPFDGVNKLKQLKKLMITDKHLVSLPLALGGLESLELLDLKSEALTTIPSAILEKLPNLKLISVHYRAKISYQEIEELSKQFPSIVFHKLQFYSNGEILSNYSVSRW